MKLPRFTFALISLATCVSSVTLPGASSPLFYLVVSSSSSTTNLAPLRLDATLTGTTPVVQFYFNSQGLLSLIDPTTNTNYNAIVNSGFNGNDCSPDGAIVFVQGSSSNKCSRTQGFEIQSDTEDSQLGSQLVFNFVGGFYACGNDQAVWYEANATDAPSGCLPISLYTIPVVG
ncbi:hypothetical protein CPB84DRAFT_1849367 [Gymnopilus junonius]|uniref:Uncharacterized protein n=1 Tax=Gymnopilus junonius TaxID=109634 RepID=A0A9P5NKN2_GYMJU|nr:hypothetical protein CPB84DRAFT_1849367 [Gymnopilus junonius]